MRLELHKLICTAQKEKHYVARLTQYAVNFHRKFKPSLWLFEGLDNHLSSFALPDRDDKE